MKKTMKKLLCSLLVVVMCLTAAPLQGFVGFDWGWLDFSVKASALSISGQCGENITYSYNSSTCKLVISGTGAMTDYTSDGSPFYNSNIKTIVIEDGVTSIGKFAFSWCTKLTSITISNSVNTIGFYAFWNCDSLKSIKLPENVTTIDGYAFADCTKLTSVTIPNSVTKIVASAFDICINLKNITVDEDNNSYSSSEEGVLFNKDKTILVRYPSGKTKTSYVIPDSVKSIGSSAFENCETIKNIIIPNSVTSIGAYTFRHCRSLNGIVIPNSVTSINSCAFEECDSLKNITIPESVITIGILPFRNCDSLTNITVDENNQNYSNDENGVLFNKNKTILIQYPASNKSSTYIIPEGVNTISSDAFISAKSLTGITIPESVTTVGGSAFYNTGYYNNNSNWENGALYIGKYLIEVNTSSPSYTVKANTKVISDYAFDSCTNLTSVTIPNSVTSIGKCAFYCCYSLSDVYYDGSVMKWKKINIGENNSRLIDATIHCNYETSYFMVSSDQYSVDSIHRNEVATYKIHLLDQNNSFLPIDNVTVQNNTEYIVDVSTKKVSDTELELTVEPIKDGDASISLFNGDNSNPQYFNFTVYSNTTTYRADQVPVTNEKLKQTSLVVI